MMRWLTLSVWGAVLTGCVPSVPWDTRPPQLIDTAISSDGRELALTFDEPLMEAGTGGDFDPAPAQPEIREKTVVVALPSNLKPGKGYEWTAEVKDAGQNLTSVAGRFYGPNAHPARLRLNEIRVAGSGSHPDVVELRVEAPGSIGGWTVDAYATPTSRQRMVLPDRSVETGQLIVIHYKPTGSSEERDELVSTDESLGLETHPQAWDYWQPLGKGLSGVKGAIALRSAPDQPPVEALVYSQRPGEGLPLAQAAGEVPGLEWDPQGCTPTRTWCRTDTDPSTWMLVATGSATPGRPNRLVPWKGPNASPKHSPTTKG